MNIKVGGKNLTDKMLIEKQFYTRVVTKLSKRIQNSLVNVEVFMKNCDRKKDESALTVNELNEAFLFSYANFSANLLMMSVLMLSV